MGETYASDWPLASHAFSPLDAFARHPRLQMGILWLLQELNSGDEALSEESQYGFRKSPLLGKAALYNATIADSEIFRPVIASVKKRSDAGEIPSIRTAHGAGMAHAAPVPQYDKV